MADERDLEITKELNEQLKRATELSAKRAEEEGKSLSRREKELELLSRREQLIRQANDLLTAKKDKLDEVQEALEREIQKEQAKGQIDRDNAKARLDFIKRIAEARRRDNANAEAEIEKIVKALEKQNEQQKKNTEAFQAGEEAAGAMVAKLGQAAGLGGQTAQHFKKLGSAIQGSGGLKNATLGLAKGFASSAREMLSFANMGGMVVENTFEQSLKFDDMRAKMSALSGGQRELAQRALETSDAMGDQFLRFDQLGESTITLFREFGKFTSLQPSLQNQLAGTTAGLAKLGVAEGQTSDALNLLVTGLGFTAEEAQAQVIGLTEEASRLQVGPDQLINSLVSLRAPLADFGMKGPTIFKKMAAEAKRLGIDAGEMGQKMFNLSDSVDTFSKSADVASTLASVLGSTTLNVTELTMAAAKGPAEVRRLIQQEFDRTGKTFSDLEFFERKALAEGLRQSTEDLETFFGKAQKGAELVTKEETKFEDQVKNATTAAEKKARAFQDLAGPIKEAADALNIAAEKFQAAAETLGPGGALGLGAGMSALGMVGDIATTALALKGGFKALRGLKGPFKPDLKDIDVMGGGGISTKKGGANLDMGRAIINPARLAQEAGEAGLEAGLEGAAKAGAKGLGKSFIKKIPLVGLLASLGFAGGRLLEGDFAGAGLEVASGAASIFPGAGTAASVAIDAGLAARDMGAFETNNQEVSPSNLFEQRALMDAGLMAGTAPAKTITPAEMEMAVKNALQSVGGSEQPIKVEVYLDKNGTNKIAETTVKYIDRNYTMHNNARVPI
tara:strand:+ start:1025 stop:3394 length:2370 start_codon:yes stop_codon:yes gene_type:complete